MDLFVVLDKMKILKNVMIKTVSMEMDVIIIVLKLLVVMVL